MLISEKSPVLNKESIIRLLEVSSNICPTWNGMICKIDSSDELLRPIKLILLIGLEKDWVVKNKKRREIRILNLFFIFLPVVVNF